MVKYNKESTNYFVDFLDLFWVAFPANPDSVGLASDKSDFLLLSVVVS